MSNDIQTKFRGVRKGLVYAQETAKLEFASDLYRLMERVGINQRTLAERLGKPESQISKALRGDCNLTIETMVALAHECAGRLHFKLTGASSTLRWAERIDCKKLKQLKPDRGNWALYSGRVEVPALSTIEAEGSEINVAAA